MIRSIGLFALAAFALAAQPASAALRVTEWMYNGTPGEYFELTNLGAAPVDTTGWSYSDEDNAPGTEDLSGLGVVAPGQSVIVTEATSAAFASAWNLSGVTILGGITDNLPRILPEDTHALIRIGSWPVPDLFLFLQETGEVETEEMFRVFNMGIGMILAVDPAGLAETLGLLRSTGQKSWVLGTLQSGGSGVVYDLGPESPQIPSAD